MDSWKFNKFVWARLGPSQVDWRHLKDASEIVDQGSCGSCWAISLLAWKITIRWGSTKRWIFVGKFGVNADPKSVRDLLFGLVIAKVLVKALQ